MSIHQLLAAVLALMTALGGGLHAAGVTDYLSRQDSWFRTDEARRITRDVLSWQAAEGGWPKNTDTTKPFGGDRAKLKGTFDNGATTGELRFLARAIGAQSSESVNSSNAFLRGLAHILQSQYTNGGWPQYSPPPPRSYHRHITFNDHSMVRLMTSLREVAADRRYDFVDAGQRAAAQRAFDRGVECILKCQIKLHGRLTAWCAQHDEIDFSPRPARSFEPASLSGAESVGITRLLMSIERPAPEVVRAVEAAVAWFESARLMGINVVEVRDAAVPGGNDKVVQKDASAKPMWARFYELETGRPVFSGRDGVKKYSLAEIEHERRNGYAWLGYWPESLLEKEYPAWKAKRAATSR